MGSLMLIVLVQSMSESEMVSTDVIIVGAGLTGLTLASDLAEKGVNFVILEARERIGGRIHSIKTKDGAVVEMGATWFFPNFKNLGNLLKKLKIGLTEQHGAAGMYRIKGGTGKIVDTLYSQIDQSKVLLGQKVTKIRQTEEGMEVTSNGKVFKTRRVVTTIPPQLLSRSVQFSPALPHDVMNVMMNTHTWMGEAIKGAVTYKTPFWKSGGWSGAIYSYSGPFVQAYDQSNSEGGALVGFMSGRVARLSYEERRKKTIEQLVEQLGERAGDYLEYRDTVWNREEFTMPSQAPSPHQHQNNGHNLYQSPLMGGGLIVGGTETSNREGGYMEGAVNSAKKIASMITKSKI